MARRGLSLVSALLIVLGSGSARAGELSWDSLLARADQFHSTKRDDSACKYATAALAIADSLYGPSDTTVGLVLSKLGLFQVWLNPSEAMQTFGKALAIWELNPSANPRVHARTLNALGILTQREGRYSEADRLLRESLTLKRATLPPRDKDIAVAHNNLAVLDIDWGRYADADQELHKASEILLNTPPFDSGAHFINFAALYIHQFRYRDAAEAGRGGLRVSMGAHFGPGIVRTAHNLAVALTHLGDYAAADSLYSTIFKYFDTASQVQSDWYLRSSRPSFLIDGAQTKRELRQFAAADSLLTLADSLAAILSPPEFRLRYLSLYQRGMLECDRGQWQAAAGHLRDAISYGDSTLGPLHPSLASSHQALAETFLQLGSPDDAYREARTAASNLHENLQTLIATVPDDDALMYATQLANAVALTLRALKHCQHPSAQDNTYAADLILRTKGITSEVLLARHQDIASRRDRPSRELRERRAYAAKLLTDDILAGRGSADSTAYANKIDSLQEAYRRASDELARTDAAFNQRVQSWKVTGRQLQKMIPANAIALDYYEFPLDDSIGLTDYALVAITKEQSQLYWLSTAGHIDSVIAEYAGELQKAASQNHAPTTTDVDVFRHTSETLTDLVLGPIHPKLSGKSKLLISPAGQLASVSFPGLWSGQDRYLVETHEIEYFDAIRQIAATPTEQSHGEGLLAVGDPDFDSSAAGPNPGITRDDPGELAAAPPFLVRGTCSRHLDSLLVPLPGSRSEIAGIKEIWQKTHERFDALTGVEASEDQFKMRAPGHRILHLATHGFSLRDDCETGEGALRAQSRETITMNPLLRSGLLLAGARQAIIGHELNQRNNDDGILSALEVTDLDLRGVQLVTLSSCESGLGAIRAAEGMYGLRRAFSIAGARDVLASLWRVPDAATASLMPGIYSRLGKPLSQAVREAEIEYLSRLRAQGLADHPFLWAAFVPYVGGRLQQGTRSPGR